MGAMHCMTVITKTPVKAGRLGLAQALTDPVREFVDSTFQRRLSRVEPVRHSDVQAQSLRRLHILNAHQEERLL